MTAPLVVFVVGFFLGLAVGRWWALVAAAAVAVWIGARTEVDAVPPWLLGLGRRRERSTQRTAVDESAQSCAKGHLDGLGGRC